MGATRAMRVISTNTKILNPVFYLLMQSKIRKSNAMQRRLRLVPDAVFYEFSFRNFSINSTSLPTSSSVTALYNDTRIPPTDLEVRESDESRCSENLTKDRAAINTILTKPILIFRYLMFFVVHILSICKVCQLKKDFLGIKMPTPWAKYILCLDHSL